MPPAEANMNLAQDRVQNSPPVKIEHPRTPGSAPNRSSGSFSTESPPPALENEFGIRSNPDSRASSPVSRPGSGASDDSDNPRDENWDPSQDKERRSPKRGARNHQWRDAVAKGEKLSSARDTRVQFNQLIGRWEAKLRLDPILPFQSVGFYESEEKAMEQARAKLKERTGGVFRGHPGTQKVAQKERMAEIKAPTTRSRTGRKRRQYTRWMPEMEDHRPQHLSKLPKEKQEAKLLKRLTKQRTKRKRGRPRTPPNGRTPPLRIPLESYGSRAKIQASPALIQQSIKNYKLPCPANNYTRGRSPCVHLTSQNPYDLMIAAASEPAPKRIKTEGVKLENGIKTEPGLPPRSPFMGPMQTEDQNSYLNRFNHQEDLRAEIREAFNKKFEAERSLVYQQKLAEKKLSLLSMAKQLDNSITTLFDAMETHESVERTSEDDLQNSKKVMKEFVQKRKEVDDNLGAIEAEQAKFSDSAKLREDLTNANTKVESLRLRRYEFDGTTTSEYLVRQMRWNPFSALNPTAQGYFTHYLHGSILKFEIEFWTGGRDFVIRNVLKILHECGVHTPAQLDEIHRNLVFYLG